MARHSTARPLARRRAHADRFDAAPNSPASEAPPQAFNSSVALKAVPDLERGVVIPLPVAFEIVLAGLLAAC